MYHRYGRHGPHAWRRWREKHFVRYISVVGHVERETVIHLQLPFVNAERIIIIVMNMDDNGRELAQVVEATQMNQLTANNHRDFEELKWAAKADASKKAQRDLDNLEDAPSLEDLRAYAKPSGLQYVQEHITAEVAEGKTLFQLRDIYVDAFIEGYREYREHETGNGTLTDNLTLTLKKKARDDKTRDDERQSSLTDIELLYQSVIRVHSQLRSDPREPDYLQAIGKYVEVYQFEYEKYDPTRAKEEHRPNGSSQFPSYSNRSTY